MVIAKKLLPLYREKLGCDGLTLSNNAMYSQEIKHYHMHFIPRYKDDMVVHSSNKEILKDIKIIKDKLVK